MNNEYNFLFWIKSIAENQYNIRCYLVDMSDVAIYIEFIDSLNTKISTNKVFSIKEINHYSIDVVNYIKRTLEEIINEWYNYEQD